MALAENTHSDARALPAIDAGTLMLLLVSGATATIAFDLWGQWLSPALGLASLAPVGLARSLLGTFGLPNGAAAGHFMHLFLVGLIAYPVGWLFVARPILSRFGLHDAIGGTLYGVALWVFAIGGVTTVAGLPFFLNFSGITWVALIGHALYGLVCALTVMHLQRRPVVD